MCKSILVANSWQHLAKSGRIWQICKAWPKSAEFRTARNRSARLRVRAPRSIRRSSLSWRRDTTLRRPPVQQPSVDALVVWHAAATARVATHPRTRMASPIMQLRGRIFLPCRRCFRRVVF